MTYWIVSDTHLGHVKMLEPEIGRPEKFERLILSRLSSAIRDDDVLIHLGDAAFGDEAYWHEQLIELPGHKKWFIMGNHDKRSMTWYLDAGWDFVGERVDLVRYGYRIALTHKPIAPDNRWDFNVHGHFHNTNHRLKDPEFNDILTDRHILVKMEHEYRPFSLKDLVGGKS